MAPVKFFFDLLSPPSRALVMFFKMAKIPFEEHAIALRKREHLTEEFQKNIGKFNRVPVMHDGDFRLTESIAILRYMVKKHEQVEDFWYPKEPQERARVDEYLSWSHNNIRMAAGMAFFTKFRDPILTGVKAKPELVKKFDKNLQKCLNEMELLWMDSRFIAGDKFTIADVFASCDLEQTRMTGIDPLNNRPKMTEWFNRTRKELEPLFTQTHKFVYIIEDMLKNKKD